MHRALILLLFFRLRAYLRYFFAPGKRLPQKIIGLALGCALIFFWTVPTFIVLATRGRHRPVDSEQLIIVVTPLVALAVVSRIILAFGAKAIAFTPAETDIVIPGPFTRRSLVMYKLAFGWLGPFLAAIVVGVQSLRFTPTSAGAFLGPLLIFTLIQMLTVAVALIRQRIGATRYAVLAAGLGVAVLIAGALLLWNTVSGMRLPTPDEFRAMVTRTHTSPWARVALAPFEVFAWVVAAETLSGVLLGALGALTVLAGLLWIILRLERTATDAIVSASAALAADRAAAGEQTRARWRPLAPDVPWLWGAGPLIFRRTGGMLRSWKSMLAATLAAALIPVCIKLLLGSIGADRGALSAILISFGINGAIVMFLVVPATFRHDFRADFQSMDTLKTLPLRPLAIAAGQVLPGALAWSTMCALMGASTWAVLAASGRHIPAAISVLAAFAVAPVMVVLFSMENIIFLLFPSDPGQSSAADMNRTVRKVIAGFAKMFFIAGVGVCVGAPALLVGALTDGNRVAMAATGVAALAGVAALSVLIVGMLFRRFDPAADR